MPIKEGCASKTRTVEEGMGQDARAGVGVVGWKKRKFDKRKAMKSVCVRAGDREGEVKMVAHSLFLCHKLSWAFACSVFNLSVI